MNFIDNIKQRAKQDIKTIVLPEAEDLRVLKATDTILKEKFAKVVLVGDEEIIVKKAKENNIEIEGAKIVNPSKSENYDEYVKLLVELRKNKGMTEEEAKKLILDPVYFGMMMVKEGVADGLVSGAAHSTADTLRPALQILKTAEGTKLVSAFFVIVVPNCEYGENGTFIFADSGLNPNPGVDELEAIAVSLGLPAEGGTENFRYETKNTTSELSDYLRVGTYNKPKMKFFLRAESFYNFSSEVERLVEEDGFGSLYSSYGGNLHECSHGESFIRLVQNRFTDHGLYILDEPEAALSPQRQLSLLCLIDQLAKEGSQFIIATHSPILISYRNGVILDLNNNSYDYLKIH